MIVVDASVVVDMLLGAGSPAGDTLVRRLGEREPACAPHLLDAEVAQVLRRFTLAGDLTVARAAALIDDLEDLPLHRYAHPGLVRRAFELRSNVTVYDGLYLALAEALDCPLLTGDTALMGVPGSRAAVEVVPTSA